MDPISAGISKVEPPNMGVQWQFGNHGKLSGSTHNRLIAGSNPAGPTFWPHAQAQLMFS
jgi:hypothetical protein